MPDYPLYCFHESGNACKVALMSNLSGTDFSMCGYLYYGDEIGIDFAAFPNVVRWLGDIRSQPG